MSNAPGIFSNISALSEAGRTRHQPKLRSVGEQSYLPPRLAETALNCEQSGRFESSLDVILPEVPFTVWVFVWDAGADKRVARNILFPQAAAIASTKPERTSFTGDRT